MASIATLGASPGYGGVYAYMLQVIFGLLVLSAVAPMSLSEERQRGSLDVLMTTPLSTRTIVDRQMVEYISPGPLAGDRSRTAGPGPGDRPRVGEASRVGVQLRGSFSTDRRLIVATILAHGAAITSIGLILATWIRRQARAIGISVALFVLVSIGWPIAGSGQLP